ncbi:Phosphoribosyl isomerase A [Methyloligella halotolerans]|uniref:Phosphoribosyl isomerase A n=1 Tax=Methyloligella halotolerans TaxID=1177755 RepID=A0A1E2S388_9HYPH|nr:HisA/HisF-related TIM barrel protein [Methyloligella halotolerans]ODA68795.1 Phosphoribosyl isomerase A [Methyloligella halotolerans]
MRDFSVIPVLDLMDGQVVHGKAGARETYRPIQTPLGSADDPVALASALVDRADAGELYIADLDAIERTGDHLSLCRRIKAALPDTQVWVDAGLTGAEPVRLCLEEGLTPIIGSESLGDLAQWASICAAAGDDVVLSLDFDQAGFRGPEMLLADAKLWPSRIIVMTLGAVGSNAGPDIAKLAEIGNQARAGTALYAAGGIRGVEDLDVAAGAGASGALVATALHRGALTQKEIAAFRRRRRLSASNTTP